MKYDLARIFLIQISMLALSCETSAAETIKPSGASPIEVESTIQLELSCPTSSNGDISIQTESTDDHSKVYLNLKYENWQPAILHYQSYNGDSSLSKDIDIDLHKVEKPEYQAFANRVVAVLEDQRVYVCAGSQDVKRNFYNRLAQNRRRAQR